MVAGVLAILLLKSMRYAGIMVLIEYKIKAMTRRSTFFPKHREEAVSEELHF